MKWLVSQSGLLATLVATATAFPAQMMEEATTNPETMKRAVEMLSERKLVKADGATKVFEPVPIFNEEKQFIDVGPGSGHEWQAPTKNDLRGPCPGLNAFANHGFLPRNGYATISQFIDATSNVVGMGPQLAIFLAALGATIDGDGTAWSIGGTPTADIAGQLGTKGNGISGSHNKYESDASPTRPDLYQYGNDYKTRAQQFQKLIDMSPGGQVDLESLTNFRAYRFNQSIQENPYFFNGPFTGVLVQPAAYTFIYRFMANHSAEYPYGYLSYDTISSWFAIKGKSGSYKAVQGHERIPAEWYRRALEYPYDNEYFALDVLNAGLLYPQFFDIGGNLGKPNTFTGVNVNDLTGGVFNGKDLTKNNNFACLAFEFATQAVPDVLLAPLAQLENVLGKITTKLACPQLSKIDAKQLKKFPGYQKSESTAGY